MNHSADGEADRPKVHPRFDQEGFRACFDRIRNHDASGDPQITADAKSITGQLGDLILWMEGEIRRRDVMLERAEQAHQETVEQLQLEIATFDRTQKRLESEAHARGSLSDTPRLPPLVG